MKTCMSGRRGWGAPSGWKRYMTCKTRASTRSALPPVKRSLWQNVGFEADKLERRLLGRIAAHCRDGLRTRFDAPGVLLVHVHTQVQRHEATQKQKRLRRSAGGGEFAGANVES